MKEFIIMLTKGGIDFEKKTNRGGNGEIKDIKVVVTTDGNGAATIFTFNKDEELQYVSHN